MHNVARNIAGIEMHQKACETPGFGWHVHALATTKYSSVHICTMHIPGAPNNNKATFVCNFAMFCTFIFGKSATPSDLLPSRPQFLFHIYLSLNQVIILRFHFDALERSKTKTLIKSHRRWQ